MAITVLAGGHGGAKFVRGLREALGDPPDDVITVIGNTADDLLLHGLNISPDLDTLMYTLGGGLDEQRGWGRMDESFQANGELAEYGLPGTWFGLGDRDLATHLVRTQMLAAGYSLTDVTAALCVRWHVGVRLLPMSDDRVETHVVIHDDQGRRAIHFQEWWIRHRAAPVAEGFVMVGADEARPGPAVVRAIMDAECVLLAPSNPVVSIGAILSVSGIRAALQQTSAPVVGVSPVIGGRPVRGMARQCLAAIGVDCDAAAVGRHYGARRDAGLLDGWLVDTVDDAHAPGLHAAGIACAAVPLLMTDVNESARIAAAALDLARSVQR
jgi:LPPG:FO 2-phospho-L-lactate transferase